MKLNKLCINAMIYVCAISICLAQDTTSTVLWNAPNTWTMEFGIAPNFTLTSFQGTAISLSRYISNYEKIRVGISTALNSTSNKSEEQTYYADTLFSKANNNGDNGYNTIQLTAQYLTYASPNGQISMFFAIGPLAGITWIARDNQRENLTIGYSQGKDINDETQNRYFLGIIGSCGVEWFFSERFSLHAEYGIAGSYNWSKNEATLKYLTTNSPTSTTSVTRREYSSSSSEWSLGSQNIIFGLSVKF